MAHYVPSFLGSTERSASQFSEWQSLRNHLLEVQDDENIQEDETKDKVSLLTAVRTLPVGARFLRQGEPTSILGIQRVLAPGTQRMP